MADSGCESVHHGLGDQGGFTTFGTFSIAAGILLVFLIFVMLAAERRGELGIARAIGTFIALTSIVVGTALGLLLAYEIIRDSRQQQSWHDLEMVVPWLNLGIIFLIVYVVAIAATLAPALRASRSRPAEALRYE